eukprot:834486-Prymnesium_polylepis.1
MFGIATVRPRSRGRFFVIGGSEDGATGTTRVDVFDVARGVWEAAPPPMTARRSNAAAAVVGGKIYVIGGFHGSTYLSSVEVYDPARS